MEYQQQQAFHPSWIIASAIFSLAVVIGSAYDQANGLSGSVLILILFLLLLFGALLMARLRIRINEDGIFYGFFPFNMKRHKIGWHEIERAELKPFSALAEYGGWGVRYNFFSKTKAFVARSGTGLFIELKDGRRRMFSISDPERLKKQMAQQPIKYN